MSVQNQYAPPAASTALPWVTFGLGLAGWITCGLTGLAAAVVGVFAVRKARQLGQPAWPAIAGIAFGLLSVVAMLAWVFVAIPEGKKAVDQVQDIFADSGTIAEVISAGTVISVALDSGEKFNSWRRESPSFRAGRDSRSR